MSAESVHPRPAEGPLSIFNELGRALSRWGARQAERVEAAGRKVAPLTMGKTDRRY